MHGREDHLRLLKPTPDDWDIEHELDQIPANHGPVWGFLVVGTYLCLAFILALNGWIMRKLWNHDKGGEKMKDAKDAGGHDEYIG